MTRERIVETNEGIQNKLTVEIYDRFSRNMRDKGWNNIRNILDFGITKGNVLEIGPGPGYLGLEWLKQSPGSKLTGCEISPAMIGLAARNAVEYGLESDVRYVEGNSMEMPFEDNSFDAVFSNGSLHEWENPVRVFSEINRLLKSGGLFCITDMRRDVNPLKKWFIYLLTKPKEIRPGFLTSQNASYTVEEMKEMLSRSCFKNYNVKKDFFGLCITGKK